jgi:hypothetical protein
MTTLEKIKNELEAFEQKKKVFVEELRKEFPTMFKELFEKNPRIESIGWTQYTPYFNDGDECTFSVHTDNLNINGENEEEHDSLNEHAYETITQENIEEHKLYNKKDEYYSKNKVGEYGRFPNPNLDRELFEGLEAFKSVIQSIPDEFMKELFGDDAEINLTSNGIEVEQYDHD